MSQMHIRITRTQELDRVLSYLKKRYSIMSETEIIKLAVSEKYKKEVEITDEKIRKQFYHAMEEGKKIGDKMIREKGLDPDKVTEQEFHDLFLDDHKHD